MYRHLIRSFCLMLLPVLRAHGEGCEPLDTTQKLRLETFVKQWYKLSADQNVTLIDSSTVDPPCYRKLIFRVSVPAPLLTLYLTPDAQHLAFGIMNLTVDPAVAQRKIRQDFANKLNSGAWLIWGDNKSVATMVVFSDFECPYCKRLASIVNDLTPGERTQLRIVYRHLPLKIHPWARNAAALSTCVAFQDKSAFWKLHDFLFAHQEDLSRETLETKAFAFLSQETSINAKGISTCLNQKSFEDRLQQDEQLAKDLGIISTPSVFLNGRRISVRSVDDLRNALNAAEKEAAIPKKPLPKAASEME